MAGQVVTGRQVGQKGPAKGLAARLDETHRPVSYRLRAQMQKLVAASRARDQEGPGGSSPVFS